MNSKGFHLFCDINLTLISLSLIYTIMTFNFNFNQHFYTITRLTLSWSKSPIENVIFSSDRCDSNKNYKYLVNYKWPGTISGCDCTNLERKSYSFEGKILPSSCLNMNLERGCKDIAETERVNIEKWKNMYLCYIDTGLSYFENLRTQEECPESYKNCGRIDTLGNKLCVKNEDKCPINHISINSEKVDVLELFVDINDPYSGEIISEFRFSDDHQICTNVNENYFYENSYILFNENTLINRKGCTGKLGNDNRFKLIDSLFKNRFYHDNKIHHYRYILPNYPDLGKSKVYLYAGNYVGWSTNERCQIDEYQYLSEIEEKYLNNRTKFEFRNKGILVMILLMIGLLVFILKFKYLDTMMIYKELVFEENTSINLIVFYGLILLINFLIFVICNVNVDLMLLGKQNAFKNLSKIFFENCSDAENNISLNSLGNYYFSIIYNYNYMKYASFVNLILCAIIGIGLFFSKTTFTPNYQETNSEYSDSEIKSKFD